MMLLAKPAISAWRSFNKAVGAADRCPLILKSRRPTSKIRTPLKPLKILKFKKFTKFEKR